MNNPKFYLKSYTVFDLYSLMYYLILTAKHILNKRYL